MKKRALSFLLTLVMVIGLLPWAARAEEPVQAAWGTKASQPYTGTLNDAIDAAALDSAVTYIKLLAPIDTEDYTYAINGGGFTLDLNGQQLTGKREYFFDIQNAEVVFTDSGEGGTVSVDRGSSSTSAAPICVRSGTVTITGGTYCGYFALSALGGTITVTGGSLKTNDYGGIANLWDSTLIITGGSHQGLDHLFGMSEGSKLVLTGGTFAPLDEYNAHIKWWDGTADLSGYADAAGFRIKVVSDNRMPLDAVILPAGVELGLWSGTMDDEYLYGDSVAFVAVPVEVRFDANGGSGIMENETVLAGEYTLPECAFTAPDGKSFQYWLVNGERYVPGDVIMLVSNTTIQPVWDRQCLVDDVLMEDGMYLDCSGNLSDRKSIGGYAHFENGVLTLNNYVNEEIDGDGITILGDTQLVLKGQNKLAGENLSDGIDMCDGCSLTISGRGSLEILCEEKGIDANGDGNVTIKSGTITIVAAEDEGIDVDSDGVFKMTGGTVDITVLYNGDGIDSSEDVEITGGTLTICAYNEGIECEDLKMTGGTIDIKAGYAGLKLDDAPEITGGRLSIRADLHGYGEAAICCDEEMELEDVDGVFFRLLEIEYEDGYTEAFYVSVNEDGELLTEVEINLGTGALNLPDRPVIPGGAANIQNSFEDVSADAWYHDAVVDVCSKGLMTGTAYDRFSPDETTTRAMIVTILWRREGSPMGMAPSGFSDNDLSSWYGHAVEWAAAYDIVVGSGGKFSPNEPITREQLAAILFRYAKYRDQNVWHDRTDLTGFADAAQVSGWAQESMQWAVGAGLINGADGKLLPQGTASRAQTAAVLSRYFR